MNTNVRACVAGVAAGVPMLVCLILGATHSGMPWNWPIRWMTSLLGGAPALLFAGQANGGMSTAVCMAVGLTIHAIISFGLARLFILCTASFKRGFFPPAGVAYGLLVWAIMAYALLPMFDQVMSERVRLIPFAFLAASLVYGLALGSVLTLSRFRSYSE